MKSNIIIFSHNLADAVYFIKYNICTTCAEEKDAFLSFVSTELSQSLSRSLFFSFLTFTSSYTNRNCGEFN